MMKNMGTVDRAIRIAIAIVIAALIATGNLSGTLAIVLGVIAAVFLLTSLIGTCPRHPVEDLYAPPGVNLGVIRSGYSSLHRALAQARGFFLMRL